jgi:regulator of sigma E protease
VLNLLPIPILDGGHILFLLVEALKGSPLSIKKMEIAQQIGLSILFVVMAFAFFNDMNRLFSG